MYRAALQVLACPECRLPLTLVDGTLRCGGDHDFEIDAGLLKLVRESDRPAIHAFADSYGRVWSEDGWGSPDPAYLANLPYRDITHRHRREWKVKARSMLALIGVLNPTRCRRVLDLGCGNGWLSHHLALRGHDVYAVDIVLDETVGLGAAGAYVRLGPPFHRIWGDLNHLPFQSSSMDAVVCNASLHYARDLHIALQEIGRVLHTGGLLAILNSPVYIRPDSAARGLSDFRAHLRDLGSTAAVTSTYHHFINSDLDSNVRSIIGPLDVIRFDPGRWFRLSRQFKGFVLRMELASFPILIAMKRDGPALEQTQPYRTVT